MSFRKIARIMLSAPLVLAWSAASAPGQIATALLRSGEPIPGDPSGLPVFNFNGIDVNNSGGFACVVNTDPDPDVDLDLIGNLWGSGTDAPGAFIRTIQTIGDYQQNNLEFNFGIDESGSVIYSVTTTYIPLNENRDTIWIDDTLVIAATQPMPVPISSTFSSSNNRPDFTADGTPHWITITSDTPGGSSSNSALLFDNPPTVDLFGGQFINGGSFQVLTASSAIDNDYRYSPSANHLITPVRVAGATSTTDTIVVIDDNAASIEGFIVREGSPISADQGGLPGENWQNFDWFGIRDNGEWLMTGDTSAATSEDEFIALNGNIILREGQMLGAETLISTIDGAYMNADGDWAAVWQIAASPTNFEVLIFNGEIVLTEREAVDWNGDGAIDAGDNNGHLNEFFTSALGVSDRDENGAVDIYFFGEIDFNGTFGEGTADDDDLQAFMRLTIAPDVTCTPGDFDDDMAATIADVGPFTATLLDPAAATPDEQCAADTNLDTEVNALDVESFVGLLLN